MNDVTLAFTLVRRAGTAVMSLFVVAVLAGATAAALAGSALAGGGGGARPEPCCAAGGPPAEPTALPDPDAIAAPVSEETREGTLPTCLVGSWRVTSERYRIEFYSDVDPIEFRSSGREYVFRPDGTGTVRYDGVAANASYQGDALRVDYDGEMEFTWEADESAVTYHGYPEASGSWRTFVNSSQTNSGQFESSDEGEVDEYECRGDQMEERNQDEGYQATWERTEDFGEYG